jgi:hypothetical protein
MGLTMVPATVGILAMVLWQASGTGNVDLQQKPGDVVQPEIVIPGEWLMDRKEQFLFLPLTVPANVQMSQCKVMSNGESLLVVVTEQPQEEPETNALRKYKLVVEAIKKETLHDETLLKQKLQTWLDTEDDDEVKVHIKAALDSLTDIQQAKQTAASKSVSVSLGISQPAASSLVELDAVVQDVSKPVAAAPATPLHALPAVLRGASKHNHHHRATRVIKESFAVEIPYPVPSEKISLLRTTPTTLMAAMPLVRKSLEARGISTGGKAFNRVPVFDKVGKWIAGPRADLSQTTAGLNLAMVVGQVGFSPLSDD